MTEPSRWLDGNGAPDGARELLARAQGPAPLSAAAKARSAVQLAARVAAAPSSASPLASWVAGKGLALVATVGLATIVAIVAVRSPRADRPAPPVATTRPLRGEASLTLPIAPPVIPPPPAPEPPPAQPIAPASPACAPPRAAVRAHARMPAPAAQPTRAARAEPVAPPAPEPVAPRAPEPEPRRAPGALDVETAMLRSAQTALLIDPHLALREAEVHAARFPDGQLAEAREFVAIQALARLGRGAEARARGEAFFARFPRSIFASRVRAVMGSAPP